MSDNNSLPSIDPKTSPYDIPQNNNVLPRNIFTGGIIPGNTVIQVGQNGPLIDGKNKLIGTGSSGQRIEITGGDSVNANTIRFYYSNGTIAMEMQGGSITFYDPANPGVALTTIEALTGNNALVCTNNIIAEQSILANTTIKALGGYLSSYGNPGISTTVSYLDAGSDIHTLIFEDGLLTDSI